MRTHLRNSQQPWLVVPEKHPLLHLHLEQKTSNLLTALLGTRAQLLSPHRSRALEDLFEVDALEEFDLLELGSGGPGVRVLCESELEELFEVWVGVGVQWQLGLLYLFEDFYSVSAFVG